MTGADYKPEWRKHVVQKFTVTGMTQPVNPTYFLTDQSAYELAEILKDLSPRLVLADPWGAAGATLVFFDPDTNEKVMAWWLVFPSGAAANAGREANLWPPAPDGNTAEQRCREDLKSIEAEYAVEHGGQYPVQLQALPK